MNDTLNRRNVPSEWAGNSTGDDTDWPTLFADVAGIRFVRDRDLVSEEGPTCWDVCLDFPTGSEAVIPVEGSGKAHLVSGDHTDVIRVFWTLSHVCYLNKNCRRAWYFCSWRYI